MYRVGGVHFQQSLVPRFVTTRLLAVEELDDRVGVRTFAILRQPVDCTNDRLLLFICVAAQLPGFDQCAELAFAFLLIL